MPSVIKILPEYLIDQIKAGEVIEGPSSLLKELIENSIDAKSDYIKINIENSGLDLITVEDNGQGMAFEDLPLAFSRHATSKISKFEDLYTLLSFGFRGEALASIAAISKITAFSKPLSENGGKIVINGGKCISHVPMDGLETGTSIFIKDLFFNTPVRFKFIKSKSSEKLSIIKTINSFILSNPNIQFSVKWDQKERAIYRPTAWKERIFQILPKSNFLEISSEYQGYSVKGFISLNCSKGNQKNSQFLFINNRFFLDRILHSSIINSMEGIWRPSEYGSYCIFINADPSQTDINVHPKKLEVRFSQPQLIFSLLRASIKNGVTGLPKNIKTTNILKQIEKDSFEEQNLFPVFRISKFFSIFPKNGKYLLIKTDSLLKSYISLHFKMIDDEFQVPLLIAEPYNLPRTFEIDALKPYGFIFEKMSEDKILLIAIPSYLSELPFREIVGEIIRDIASSRTCLVTKNFNLEQVNLSFNHLRNLINFFEPDWQNENSIKILDEKLINSIFYDQ